MRQIFLPLYLPLLIFLSACNAASPAEEGASPASHNMIAATINDTVAVSVAKLSLSDFSATITFNGVVAAKEKIDIQFPAAEIITGLSVANGSTVRKGYALAVLDGSSLARKLERNRESIEKSLVDLDDRLIDYGFRLKDSATVPPDILKMAKVRSGYSASLAERQDLEYELSRYTIRSPVDGKIADLEASLYNPSTAYRKLCTVIKDDTMMVNFLVLESEGPYVRPGAAVIVFSGNDSTGKPYHGKVSLLNPRIDENGMIRSQAMVINEDGRLLDGMHVTIRVIKTIPRQLLLPRQAVVKRQGRNVVFSYKQGKAKWNYVDVVTGNDEQLVIKGGLMPGDSIIVSGNENLANDTPVSFSH